MPYFVSCIMDGRSRKFAYPHASVETALGFARESLEMDCDDVWVSDETGETIADRFAIADMPRVSKAVDAS